MKKYLKILISFPFMGFLLLVLAIAMAIATFVESSYGTEAAQGLIYKSLWFSLILLLLSINLIVNFFRFSMYKRPRLSMGLFHIAFIVIIIGAAITRYISFEGVMHIREGESSNYILSDEDYLTIRTGNQTISATVLFSELLYNDLNEKIDIDGRTIRVKSIGFIKNAVRNMAENKVEKSPVETSEDAVLVEINDGDSRQLIYVFGRNGVVGQPFAIQTGNSQIEFTYGAEPLYLPFSLQLKEFQMEKYPGSDSPSSFASELVLIDNERQVTRDVRVFMNNTLNYRGYKFFQSSYDQDEKGTVLSVNADGAGTTVTYIGYFLLSLGMLLSLFNSQSYFQTLAGRLRQYAAPSALLLFLILGNTFQSSANNEALASVPRIEPSIVNDFSNLWVQGPDGRIEPVSTLTSELLRKVSRQSDFYGRSPAEVMLGLNLYPELWRNVPLVKVSHEQIMKELGVSETRIPLIAFFDEQGNYKLMKQVQTAFGKMPAFRNVYDKEIINIDERVNICFMVINGNMFALFPGPSKETKWFSTGSTPVGLQADDSLFVNRGFQLLKESLQGNGEISGNQILASISAYQHKFGKDYLPGTNKKKVEIFYNEVNPFKRVFVLYLFMGISLLSALFFNIFRKKTNSSKIHLFFTLLISLGFLIHTIGLALRWYISGHAPWSNGYESMVYVAWASMLAGIIFGRKYPLVLGTASTLTGIILFVAHLNWMNPEITHLVPVLNSYWLMIHVAIITASYGFIGLSAFLGLLVLTLFSISNSSNKQSLKSMILQLTTISEMSVTVGLYLLTIGTFLGGVWANESWGRYWGWDAKETWALITVVIYSFIAHMRLIPSLKGIYNYSVASVLGFSSVLMTYFGVNYYLSGLHSYGRGAIDSVHWSVFVILMLIVGLLLISNFKQKNLEFEN